VSVLVVTDDPALRDLVGRALPEQPYSCAGTRAEALRRLREAGVDVVILDADLPGVRPADLAWSIYTLHPDAQIVVASGREIEASDGWWMLDIFAFVSKRAGASELERYAGDAADHAKRQRERRRREADSWRES
jgi:DNA-binding NtrC family response regulator